MNNNYFYDDESEKLIIINNKEVRILDKLEIGEVEEEEKVVKKRKNRSTQKLSEEVKNQVLKMVGNGKSGYEIAASIGISSGSVYKIIREDTGNPKMKDLNEMEDDLEDKPIILTSSKFIYVYECLECKKEFKSVLKEGIRCPDCKNNDKNKFKLIGEEPRNPAMEKKFNNW